MLTHIQSFIKSCALQAYGIFDGFGRARAAAHFSRIGRDDLAREIMLKD